MINHSLDQWWGGLYPLLCSRKLGSIRGTNPLVAACSYMSVCVTTGAMSDLWPSSAFLRSTQWKLVSRACWPSNCHNRLYWGFKNSLQQSLFSSYLIFLWQPFLLVIYQRWTNSFLCPSEGLVTVELSSPSCLAIPALWQAQGKRCSLRLPRLISLSQWEQNYLKLVEDTPRSTFWVALK